VEKTTYNSFFLRLWFVQQNGKFSWRVSLEDPHSEQYRNFDCFEDFFIFFQEFKKDQERRVIVP